MNDLPGLREFTSPKLVRGLERALQLETYEAAEYWFSWVKEAPKGPIRDRPSWPAGGCATRPILRLSDLSDRITTGPRGDTSKRRRETLIEMFEAYSEARGNDACRLRLAEALGLALSRCLGSIGEYDTALSIVERALTDWPSSIHLKAAQHALGLKLDGKMVPERFAKFIGEDNGFLKQFVCPLPFEHFEISHSGNVLVCCGHWLPTSIGNFLKDPIDTILNSNRRRKFANL